jgi:hypothetical protein
MIKRHSKLAASRAVTALLLVLAGLLLLGIDMWLGLNLISSGGFLIWLLRLVIGLVLLGAWLCCLVSVGLALGAAIWKNHPAGQASALFFQSGDGTLPDETQLARQFRETSQAQMLAGALHELYQLRRFRQRQERWLRYSILFFFISLLGISIGAWFTLIMM